MHDVVIRDLTVQGFQLDGINAHDCAKDCQLIGVIARGNGRAGIAVGGASSVRIKSCLLSDNGDEQILTDGPSMTSIERDRDRLDQRPGRWYAKGARVFYRAASVFDGTRSTPRPPSSAIVARRRWPLVASPDAHVQAACSLACGRAFREARRRHHVLGLFPGGVDVAAAAEVEHDAHDGDRDRDGAKPKATNRPSSGGTSAPPGTTR